MGMKFSNNAATTLAASVAPGDLTLTVNSTNASTFPVLGAGDYFYLTLQGLGAFGNIEVVKVTAVAGQTFTIVRAQDGTAAQAFTIGDRAELRMCSAILNELPTSATLAASSGSSLVGFLQAGTGAVARTLQDKDRDRVTVKDFGAKGDGVTDDTTAFLNAIAATNHLYVPAGTYIISQCLNLKKPITIEGESGSQAVTTYPSTLKFADNIVGIFIHRSDTTADSTGHSPSIVTATTGADGSIIANLCLQRGSGFAVATPDAISHGIWLKARANIRDCQITGFAGNGVHIVADAVSSNPLNRGNANNFDLARIRVQNNYHGIYIDGPDANAGLIDHPDCSSNQGWGVWDSSFLGNLYEMPHGAANGLGAYYTDDANARSHFSNPYSESGQPPSQLSPRTSITNGLTEAGFTAASSNLVPPTLVGTAADGTQIAKCTVTAGGSGYTTATVTIAAPTQTQATATAVLSGGILVKATISNAGAGYSSTPAVTITGDGTGATGLAHLGLDGKVKGITILTAGSGYTTATVSLAAPAAGSTATAVAAISGGAVTGIILTGFGDNYGAVPTVTISGDGTGATATATRNQDLGGGSLYTNVDHAKEFGITYGDTVLSFSSAAGLTSTWRLSLDRSSLGWCINYNALASGGVLRAFGPFSRNTFGRATAPTMGMWMPDGVWLGADSNTARNLTLGTTVPPTSGNYARGDMVFATNPSAAGSPGVVCTTGGVAGSTAVFKAMAVLAA